MEGEPALEAVIGARYREVLDRVGRACARAGRDPASVKVVAVSKTQPFEAVEAAWRAGLRSFGENRAQELVRKSGGGLPGIEWHFLGHLQTNKVRQVVGRAAMIHSVDTVRLAGIIAQEAERKGLVQPVLLQVNISGEESKSGMGRKDLEEALENIQVMSGIAVRGLMTIGPFTEDREELRRVFAELRGLRDEAREALPGAGLDLLSMGMTNDFEIAVEEGADLLRIGTAIFGGR